MCHKRPVRFVITALTCTGLLSYSIGHATEPGAASGSETGVIRGRVVHAATSEPVSDVDVRLIKRPVDHFTLPLVPKRARSNSEGEFSFDRLEPGTYLVYAFHGAQSSRTEKFKFAKVEVNQLKQQTAPLELKLSLGTQLRARVVSVATGEPVPDARLRMRWTDTDDDFRADERGEIVVPMLTQQKWHLEFVAPNYACDIRDVTLKGPETKIEVRLAPGGEISGRVVDQDGAPLSGAKLGAQLDGQAMYALDQTTSGDMGEFRLQYLPLGTPLRLSVSHVGFEHLTTSASVPAQTSRDHRTLQLSPLPDGGRVEGRVVDTAGKPIAGATLENTGTSSVNQNTTQTDAQGRFKIDRLFVHVAGRVPLTVHAKGFAPRQLDLSPENRDGSAPLEIALEPGHRMRGRVLDEEDRPVANCRVFSAGGDHANPLGGNTTTDAEGRFEFDSLPPNCPVAFYAAGYSKLEQTLPLDQDHEVVVRLKPIGVIRGSVIDAETSKPIGEFNVRIAFPTQVERGEAIFDHIESTRMNPGVDFVVADGAFELGDLPTGKLCDLIIHAKGYHRMRLVRVIPAANQEATVISVPLSPLKDRDLVKVAGKIVDADGRPAAGVQVRLIGRNEGDDLRPIRGIVAANASNRYDEFRTAITNQDGAFSFDGVPNNVNLSLLYWSDQVPVTQLDDLNLKTTEELSKLALTYERPVTVNVSIDRDVYAEISSLTVRRRDGSDSSRHSVELAAGQTEVQLTGVSPGIFTVALMGKPEKRGDKFEGFLTRTVASRRITAEPGEIVEVKFAAGE